LPFMGEEELDELRDHRIWLFWHREVERPVEEVLAIDHILPGWRPPLDGEHFHVAQAGTTDASHGDSVGRVLQGFFEWTGRVEASGVGSELLGRVAEQQETCAKPHA